MPECSSCDMKLFYRPLAPVLALVLGMSAAVPVLADAPPGMALIPAGAFEMGDHHGFVDPKHGGDETPIHTVRLDAFYIGINDITTGGCCEFLNSAREQEQIEVREGGVYHVGGSELLCETRAMSPYSRADWDGKTFSVLEHKEAHPVVCIRWPVTPETSQTSNGANGYGLYDMTRNVWQFVNDWYGRDYYAFSPTNNPAGPASGSIMPDGVPYRGMCGGNWYNGENGQGRVSNRNPSYFRGTQDPDHPYYHLGFRVVLPVDAESRPVIKPTPVQQSRGREGGPGGSPGDGRRARAEGGIRGGPGSERGDRPARPDAQSATRNDSGGGIQKQTSSFMLSSPAVKDGGTLPVEFTGDGVSATLPLEWTGAPAETKCYALIMHHVAPDQTKWYWILYDIPGTTPGLPRNVQGVGTLGNNSVNGRCEYAPPHSKGPGKKTYIYTLYALSSPLPPDLQPAGVSRDVLLAAMKDTALGSAQLRVVYERNVSTDRF